MSRKFYLFFIAFAAVLGVFAAYFTMTFNIKNSITKCETIEVSSGYNVTLGSNFYENVDVTDFSFPTLPAGTQLVYSVTLPDKEVKDPMFEMYFAHSRFKVFIDNREVYSFGQDENRMFGYGFVYFPLEGEYAGKELRVEQTVMEKGEVSSIEPVRITSNSKYFYRNYAIKYRLQFFIDLTLILMGLAMAGVSLIFMIKNPEMLRLVFLAISFFGMGTWIFANYGLISLFTNDLTLKGYVEYPSFYFAPFFFTLYFEEDYYKNEKSFRRYLYMAILVGQGLFAVISVIMHLINARHLPKSLPVSHFFLIVSLGFILYMSLRSIRQKKAAHMPFIVGFVLLILFSIRDLVLFFMYYYVRHGIGDRYESHILSGVLLFAIAMFIDFFSVQTKRVTAEARNEALKSMAYTDIMTGLSNRRGYEDARKRLSDGKNGEPFGMISFDLNDLKKTNDNYGHEEGDKLLTDFSSLLMEVYSETCIICRMGGDEFLVVAEDLRKADLNRLTETLLKRRREINTDRKPLPLSFAYGICTSDDPVLDSALKEDRAKLIEEVLKLSDKRMYECKVAIKTGMREI